MIKNLRLFGLALVGAVSVAGSVQAAPVLITGSLRFSNDQTNYFNPANGYVPSKIGNSAGITAPIGSNVEFGYNDGVNIDFADFTGTGLQIGDISILGAFDFVMTFTANRSGFFNNAVLSPNGFDGTISVNSRGNTLTFTSPNTIPGFAIRNASITFLGVNAPVPEPASWALMIAGFGLVGAAMRRNSTVTRVAYA